MAGGHAGGGDSGDYETSSVGLVGPHKPPFQRAGSLDRLPTRPTAHKTSFYLPLFLRFVGLRGCRFRGLSVSEAFISVGLEGCRSTG